MTEITLKVKHWLILIWAKNYRNDNVIIEKLQSRVSNGLKVIAAVAAGPVLLSKLLSDTSVHAMQTIIQMIQTGSYCADTRFLQH